MYLEVVHSCLEDGKNAYKRGNTELAIALFEAALEIVPYMEKWYNPKVLTEVSNEILNYLRESYCSKLMEASGVAEPLDFYKLLEQKDNPIVIEYEKKGKKLDEMFLEFTGMPLKNSSYKI